jgi:hypothetical protein
VTLVNKKSEICGSNNNIAINTNNLMYMSPSSARPSLKLYKY